MRTVTTDRFGYPIATPAGYERYLEADLRSRSWYPTGVVLLITCLALAVWIAPPVYATIIQVPDQAKTIRDALAVAQRGDVIIIAVGTYNESDLQVVNGVTIVGETGHAGDVIIDANHQDRIFQCENVDNTTIIGGLTLTRGLATGSNTYDTSGGAILCSHSQPIITNCDFIANVAAGHGGAIRITYAAPQLTQCRFIDNQAAGGGGAVDCSYGALPTLRNCRFEENVARWGGALSMRADSHAFVTNCVIENNATYTDVLSYGGGIYCDYASTPVIHYTTFLNNTARYGGAAAVFDDSSPWFGNCTIVANGASEEGGGLFCYQATPSLTNSIIAFQTGSALQCALGADAHIQCTDIFGNSGGDWIDRIADQADVRDNMSLDPEFCGLPGEGELALNLRPSSPCAPQNNDCGLLGAWKVGCVVQTRTVIRFQLDPGPQSVRVRWETLPEGDNLLFRLTGRSDNARHDEWEVAIGQPANGKYDVLDTSDNLSACELVTYTLYARTAGQRWKFLHRGMVELHDTGSSGQITGAYPNPFNPATRISFSVKRSAQTRINIYDLGGRQVATLSDEVYPPGDHAVMWHGLDHAGEPVASGIYFVALQIDQQVETRKLLLIK